MAVEAPLGLGAAEERADLRATVRPPEGWRAEPIKTTPRSMHQVWISPSGSAAFGVIYSRMPLPVGDDLALWGFMQEMKKDQGQAELLDKTRDDEIDGLRFKARGTFFSIDAFLYTKGWDCWVSYAGRYADREAEEAEEELARRARDRVVVGKP